VDKSYLTSGRYARFEYNEKKNGALLRNMCNGMKGENTIELTYSGQLSKSQKKAKRGKAGCVSGYCARLAQPGLNSCDEFPLAMSDEGGDALAALDRAINCIPGNQNSRQGQAMSTMVKRSKMVKGQKFIISIDCDAVLGSIGPPNLLSKSLLIRDLISPTNGTSTGDNLYPPEAAFNETTSSVVIGFGDLGPGSYRVIMTITSGSVDRSSVLDNLGDEMAVNTAALSRDQTQQLDFSIEADGELMGVGLILETRDNKTQISWTLARQNIQSTTTSTGSAPSQTGSSNGAWSARKEVRIMVGIVMGVSVGWLGLA